MPNPAQSSPAQSRSASDRWVALAGCDNFRDLGGYRTADGFLVRRGRIFRSDGLHGLEPDDLTTLHDLRVRTVYDLRMPEEVEEYGVGPWYDAVQAPRLVALPLYDVVPVEWFERPAPRTGADVGARYLEMLQNRPEQLLRLVRDLGREETYPAVVHCLAGRDRTGSIAALLLTVLGVAPADVEADYALTGKAITDPPVLPSTMAALLDALTDGYGGAEGFVRAAGADDGDLQALRDRLLEPGD
ncbi:hypothetical protein BH24ACT13_BH24ACT13_00340 [soil metagenome]